MTLDARSLEVAANAKVNLALAITGRREDGYHELRSVFLRLELADTLALEAGADGVDRLAIEGDPACPIDGNLVLRAVEGFRDAAADRGVVAPVVSARLVKRIPMAAGLAGGSTDAAAALRLLAARHPGTLPSETMERLAVAIGADVPFFLDGAGAAMVSGTGEEVEPLPPPIEPVGVLLLVPPGGASTGVVFDAWDALGTPDGSPATRQTVDDLATQLRHGIGGRALAGHADRLRDANELWRPATRVLPGLAALRDRLETRMGLPLMLTGSGSTLFALYPSPDAAEAMARELRSERPYGTLGIIATRSGGPDIPVITERRDT